MRSFLQARSLVGGTETNRDEIEKQVLEIWDQLYVQWVAKVFIEHARIVVHGDR